MATSSTRSAAFAMLCLIWGSTWLPIPIGLAAPPPFLSASLRFAVASIVLVLLAVVFRSKWPQNRTEWALVGIVGIVLFTGDYGLIYWGENNGVPSGLSAILFATFPLQTALVANAFLKAERFTVQRLLGIGVGFGGVVLIFRSQLGSAGPGQGFPTLSIILAATAAACASVAVLLGASLGNETFDVIDLAGAGIVLLGIYVSTSRRAAAFARAAMGQGIAEPDPVDPPPRKT